jgi:5-formyltetrahydrofolate cyclo-ligase
MREPISSRVIHARNIDMMLVPMIAYNKTNHRLGYGLNFYNSYLESEHNIYTIGLAYNFQSNDEFVTTKVDKALDVIITN